VPLLPDPVRWLAEPRTIPVTPHATLRRVPAAPISAVAARRGPQAGLALIVLGVLAALSGASVMVYAVVPLVMLQVALLRAWDRRGG
jgi:hypothetical protein